MGWNYYGLDREAQTLVLNAKAKDSDSLNQVFKMRQAVAYGLERFWGEHLRLQRNEQNKSKYWKDTWDALLGILEKAGITIPNDRVANNDTTAVRSMAEKLWEVPVEDQRVALAVLTQLCDSMVWWTQRYK